MSDMSNVTKAVVVAMAGMLLVVLGLGCSAISTNNECVRAETGLEAQYQQNQNDYAGYLNTLKETAQVPDMYVKGLEEVYKGALAGRYGDGGSKAVFQFI